MKFFISFLSIVIFGLCEVEAQDIQQYLDPQLNQVLSLEKAKFIRTISQSNDTTFQVKIVYKTGETMMTGTFRDKNLLVENTYNFLKMFKCKLIKNLKNSKFFKYIDTQIILIPSIKLFYTYINKIIYSDCKDCLFKNNNLNHYIVS